MFDLTTSEGRELYWKRNQDKVQKVKDREFLEFVMLCVIIASIIVLGCVW